MTYAEAKAACLAGKTVARDAWGCFELTAENGRLISDNNELFYPTPADIRATDWTVCARGEAQL